MKIMPIRSADPFHDHLERLRPEFNRFVDVMRTANEQNLSALQGPALKPWAQRWRAYFQEERQLNPEGLYLEIGSHLGEVLLKLAHDYPKSAFIGMDITLKRVIKVAQKAQQHELPNVLSMLANARGLDILFGPAELDGVLLFFPDPWSKKKRQEKNRLADRDFFVALAPKLRAHGFFWFKTDCLPYFEDVRLLLSELQWRPTAPQEGIPHSTYTSRFERVFTEEGLPTYSGVWLPPATDQH
jgi:tRNA (guanine-N7-)-methyltransferase